MHLAVVRGLDEGDAAAAGYTLDLAYDRDDWGDTFGTAHEVSLDLGAPVDLAGVIEEEDDEDWFRVTGEAAGHLVLEASPALGSSLSCWLTIYDSTRLIDFLYDDLPADFGADRLTRQVLAGEEVWVSVAPDLWSDLGAYDLRLELRADHPMPVPEDDFGDDVPTAEPTYFFAGFAFQEGVIETSDDVDVFLISPAENARVVVDVHDPVGSGLDPEVRVEDPDGNLIAENDDSLGGLDSHVEFDATSTDVFYVFVQRSLGSFSADRWTGAYELSMVLEPLAAPPPADPMADDHPDEPIDVPYLDTSAGGAVVEGSLERHGDRDWLVISSPQDTKAVIELSARGGSTLDPVLVVEDDFGDQVGYNDDRGDGTLNSRVEVGLTGGQNYWILVRAILGDVETDRTKGDYELRVRIGS